MSGCGCKEPVHITCLGKWIAREYEYYERGVKIRCMICNTRGCLLHPEPLLPEEHYENIRRRRQELERYRQYQGFTGRLIGFGINGFISFVIGDENIRINRRIVNHNNDDNDDNNNEIEPLLLMDINPNVLNQRANVNIYRDNPMIDETISKMILLCIVMILFTFLFWFGASITSDRRNIHEW